MVNEVLNVLQHDQLSCNCVHFWGRDATHTSPTKHVTKLRARALLTVAAALTSGATHGLVKLLLFNHP